jgi:hypothetical protein
VKFTVKEWQEFLYDCGLHGQQWLHVDAIGTAYLCWKMGMTVAPFSQERVQVIMDEFLANPDAGEEILSNLLAESHYGLGGVRWTIHEEAKQRIIKMLHFILNEKPNGKDWLN